jgi:hypothetical protein
LIAVKRGEETGVPEYVILVHGTFSYRETDEGDGWWQRGSVAAGQLGNLLGAGFQLTPAEIAVGDRNEKVPDGVFHWSGQNSERSRRLAARKLLDGLKWYENKELTYHIVAHSHGGSVVWEALQIAAKEREKTAVASDPPLKHLKSWTTVGTPFLHFVPSLTGLIGLGLFIAALWVLYLQGSWFWEYWDSTHELIDVAPLTSFVAFALTYALWALAPVLLALVLYRLFKVAELQRSETRFPDARILEFYRFVQSLGTSILIILALLSPWFINAARLKRFLATAWAYSPWALAILLVVLLSYRVNKVRSRDRGTPPGTSWVREFFRMDLSLAAIILISIALILYMLSHIFHEAIAPLKSVFAELQRVSDALLLTIGELSSKRAEVWRLAWQRPVLILPILYSVVAGVLVVGYFLSFVIFIVRSIECRRRVTTAQKAWEWFHGNFRYIACLARDEAINGLRKSQYGIAGPLLPRIKMPGTTDYGPAGRSVTPETFSSETRVNAFKFKQLVLMPIQQVYDWVFRPIYNEVFAVLVDEFVLGRFTSQAHGADEPGLRLGFVSSTPFPLEAESPKGFFTSGYLRDWYLRKFTLAGLLPNEAIHNQVRSRFAGPSSRECRRLKKATHKRAGAMVEALRSMLGVPSLAAVSLVNFLSDALKEGGEWADILIHTTYFKNQGVLRRIAHVINPSLGATPPLRPRPIPENSLMHGAVGFVYPPRGVAWWAVRWAVRGLLSGSPVLALYLAGLLILYPESRDAQLRWASSPSVGLRSIIRDAESLSSGIETGLDPQLPLEPGARWYAVVQALDPEWAFTVDASADKAFAPDAAKVVPVWRYAASRLERLGDTDAARVLRGKISDRPKTPRPGQGTRIPALPPRTPPPMSVNDAMIKLCDSLCDLMNPDPCDPGGPQRAMLAVGNAMRGLAGACAGQANLSEVEVQSIRKVVADVSGTLKVLKNYDTNMDGILLAVLAIDRIFLARGFRDDAAWVMSEARSLLEAISATCDAGPLPLRDKTKLYRELAEANRWPAERIPQALELLAAALRFVEDNPSLQGRVKGRTRIASGYARLGHFHLARELSEGSPDEWKLDVATEMLLNEYERLVAKRFTDQTTVAETLGRCWAVFDSD